MGGLLPSLVLILQESTYVRRFRFFSTYASGGSEHEFSAVCFAMIPNVYDTFQGL